MNPTLKPLILIAGGSGLIGSRLSEILMTEGYRVILLSRKAGFKSGIKKYHWNPRKGIIDPASLKETDVIINLAGAGIADKRWTAARKEEILQSRVQSVNFLAASLLEYPNKVKLLINASAIGIYGDTGDEIADEKHLLANDFLGLTCRDWEKAVSQFSSRAIRTVILRTGVVLTLKGGALKEMISPMKLRAAVIFGNGKHFISWIHMEDLCRMYIHAVENESMEGVYNAVGPVPVTYSQFTGLLKKISGGVFLTVHIPFFVLKIILGEMAVIVTQGSKVSSEKIQKNGFRFRFTDAESALKNILHKHE